MIWYLILFICTYFKIPSFVTNKLPRILAIHFPSIIYFYFLLPVILLLLDSSLLYYYLRNRLISSWKSKLATLEIRNKLIIKTGRKETLLDKFYKSAHYTALWWLSRFFLYLISFVRNQVVGKKRSTTQIASAAMLEPVLKYLESLYTI